MGLVSDCELSALSDFFGQFRDTPCTIQHSVRVPDGQSGYTETFPDAKTVLVLVADNGLPRPQVIAQQTTARTELLICFELGEDVRRTDRLMLYGQSYQVIDLRSPVSNDVFLRVVAQRREAGAGS